MIRAAKQLLEHTTKIDLGGSSCGLTLLKSWYIWMRFHTCRHLSTWAAHQHQPLRIITTDTAPEYTYPLCKDEYHRKWNCDWRR